MKKRTVLVMGAGAVLAVGMVTACSSGTASQSQSPAPSPVQVSITTTAAAMPASATFIADMTEKDDEPMTMAITVEGEKVIAYATNGMNDEAYFFGTQQNGHMDLMSMYGDTLTATFDGSTIDGDLTMNESGSTPVQFAAARVEAPAGLYTAKHGDARASWVVRSNRSITGVMNNSAPGDHKVTDAIKAQDKEFMNQVRQMRLNQQLHQAPAMQYGTWSMDVDGSTVTATRVTGDMSF